jgi:hypothetical protein
VYILTTGQRLKDIDMLKVIDNENLIRKYARQFTGKFKPFIDEKIKVKLGHQGASYPARVFWSKKLGIWLFSHAVKEVRYWNAFGVGRPKPGELVSITSEINFPWAGIDRKTGGAFAQDPWGDVFVIHRGKIGGGKRGIGKSLFEHNYRGTWSFMEDGDCLTQVAVIGAVTSVRFALQSAQFVRKIEILKSSAIHSSQTQFIFPEICFHENLVGNLPASDEPDVKSRCDRDLIVTALASLLKRWKLRIGNSENYDLFLVDPAGDRISYIFEFLTDTREKSILAAAAKALLRVASAGENPLPILVLPEEKLSQYAHLMQKINVGVIGFRIEEDRIIFPDLDKIRLDQSPQV